MYGMGREGKTADIGRGDAKGNSERVDSRGKGSFTLKRAC